jgi:fibronectin type 3 domain-containing protein
LRTLRLSQHVEMRRFFFPSFLLLLGLSSACGGSAGVTNTTPNGTGTADHVVDLSWNSSTSSDVAGYNVYRSPDGNNWSKINAGLVGSTIYDDSTVVNGDTYYYAVTAVDLEGVEGSKSAVATASVP